MRSLYVVLTSCLLGSQICSASLIDDLEDADFGLQPVSAIFDSVTERLDFGGDCLDLRFKFMPVL